MNKLNKSKRASAILLALMMIFSVACADTSISGDEQPTWETFATHDGVIDAVQDLLDNSSLPDADIENLKKIRWLSWFMIQETSPAVELFKAKYGVPEPDKGDNVIDFIHVVYENRYDKLATMIASNDSPDIFQFEDRNYPYGVQQNLFQTIDGVIDLTAPEWDATRDIIDMFKWGGKNYCPVTELSLSSSSVLYYRKSVVENAGLDDPYALFKAGRWDWNTFLDMTERFSDPVNGKYAITGYYNEESLICTTGIGIITLENGLLQNNMFDPRIDRAMEFLTNIAKNNYRYPYHELSSYDLNPREFRSGNILFWNEGHWFYEETLKPFIDGL